MNPSELAPAVSPNVSYLYKEMIFHETTPLPSIGSEQTLPSFTKSLVGGREGEVVTKMIQATSTNVNIENNVGFSSKHKIYSMNLMIRRDHREVHGESQAIGHPLRSHSLLDLLCSETSG